MRRFLAWMVVLGVERITGSIESAASALDQAERVAPLNEWLLLQIATLADGTDIFKRALNMLSAVVAGDWEIADRDCEELLRLHPAHPAAHLVRPFNPCLIAS